MPLVSIGVLEQYWDFTKGCFKVSEILRERKTEAEFSSGVDWRDPESGGISA